MTAVQPEIADVVAAEFADYTDDELRLLIERSYQLDELEKHPGWALYVDLIKAQTVTRQKLILAGGCKTLEDYAAITGWVRGAEAAMNGPALIRQKLALMRELTEELDSPTSERTTEDA